MILTISSTKWKNKKWQNIGSGALSFIYLVMNLRTKCRHDDTKRGNMKEAHKSAQRPQKGQENRQPIKQNVLNNTILLVFYRISGFLVLPKSSSFCSQRSSIEHINLLSQSQHSRGPATNSTSYQQTWMQSETYKCMGAPTFNKNLEI